MNNILFFFKNAASSIEENDVFALSFYYLVFPVFIFLLGWLKFFISLPLCLLLMIALYTFRKNLKEKPSKKICETPKDIRSFYVTCFIVIIILIYSGIGGFVHQTWDYEKHNLIFNTLLDKSFPTQVAEDKQLVYYVAYYLPSVFFAKLVGGNFFILNLFSFFYAYIGFILLALNIFIYLKSWTMLLFFLFFGGLDIIPAFIRAVIFFPDQIFWVAREKLWASFYAAERATIIQYSSMATGLWWVPQHALTAWLGMSLLLPKDKHIARVIFKIQPLLVAICLLWSPLATIGLSVFVFYNYLKAFIKKQYSDIFSFSNIFVALPLALIFVCYYQSNSEIPLAIASMWNIFGIGQFYFAYINLLITNVLVWLLFLKKEQFADSYLWLSILILIILPLFSIGLSNDLLLRASLPAIFILCLAVLKGFLMNNKNSFIRYALIFCILLASYNTGVYLIRSVVKTDPASRGYANRFIVEFKDLGNVNGTSLEHQYVGDTRNSLFYKMAKYQSKQN